MKHRFCTSLALSILAMVSGPLQSRSMIESRDRVTDASRLIAGDLISLGKATGNGGSAGAFAIRVTGKLIGGGDGGLDAIAEQDLRQRMPPLQEELSHDGAGRLVRDAFWTYMWDGAGRITRTTANAGTLIDPGALTEVVDFTYDADGRRTRKIRTVTFPQNKVVVEQSTLMWSEWLPILEIRTRDGQSIGKRWFQWGADLSGTLEGAGGIGGLVAIIEEKPSGAKRTLLPLHDGLGNVVGVVDKANGNLIARYDYGPFGEPLVEIGEIDACPFRYQTKWYDAESQHYYFGYRYYSPRLGRWLSRDPLGEAGGVNLYAYCGNDPVNRHDPLGLAELTGRVYIVVNDLTKEFYVGQSVRQLLDSGGRLNDGDNRLWKTHPAAELLRKKGTRIVSREISADDNWAKGLAKGNFFLERARINRAMEAVEFESVSKQLKRYRPLNVADMMSPDEAVEMRSKYGANRRSSLLEHPFTVNSAFKRFLGAPTFARSGTPSRTGLVSKATVGSVFVGMALMFTNANAQADDTMDQAMRMLEQYEAGNIDSVQMAAMVSKFAQEITNNSPAKNYLQRRLERLFEIGTGDVTDDIRAALEGF